MLEKNVLGSIGIGELISTFYVVIQARVSCCKTKKIRNGIENFVFAEYFSIGVKLGEKKDGKVRFSIWPPYHVIWQKKG